MSENICLVFPRSTFLIDPLVYPPLGLWYLAAQLEAQGHVCDFRDLTLDSFPADGDYDQVWISATSPQMHEVRRLAELTQGWEKSAVVLGGAAPWTNPGSCRALGFDVVVSGESDHPQTVRQIAFQGARRGATLSIAPPITPGPLDWALPPVRRWDGKYHSVLNDREGNSHRTTTLFTSRGCRNGVIWDRFVRYEPLSLINNQLQEIYQRGYTGLMFYDDILPLNQPRTL